MRKDRATAPLVRPVLGVPRAAAQDQTLIVWHSWQDEERDVLDQWIKGHASRNPEARIQSEFIPHNDLDTRFEESAPVGQGPDLVIGPPEWLVPWALRGLIRPLHDALADVLREQVTPVAWEAVTFDGAIYGVPASGTTLALYYNRDLLSSPPTGFDAMLAAAEDIAKTSHVGLIFDMSLQWTVGYLHALRGALMSASGDPTVNDQAGREWLSLLAEVQERSRGTNAIAIDYRNTQFRQGFAAMIVDGSWNLKTYRATLGNSLGAAPLPLVEGQRPAPWVRTENFYVNAAASQQRLETALDFLALVTSQNGQAVAASLAGHVPINADTSLADPLLRTFLEQATGGAPFPNRPELEAYWAPMQNAIRTVTGEGVSPASALEAATAAITARIAEIRAAAQIPVAPLPAPTKEPVFPFGLQERTVTLVPQEVYPELGCTWQGIGGEVLGPDGEPVTGMIVHVRGSDLDTFVVSGTAPAYGASGWETFVGEEVNSDVYFVQLMQTDGELASDVVRVRFSSSCQGNLALVNFVQLR